jgi:hypothetical protein
VLLADGASHTSYVYQGNFTTITDPAGNWKQYASDALGNLVTVLEPDPANPGERRRIQAKHKAGKRCHYCLTRTNITTKNTRCLSQPPSQQTRQPIDAVTQRHRLPEVQIFSFE